MKALEGKYFYRLIDNDDGGCMSQHGKILAAEGMLVLVQFNTYEEGIPVEKPVLYHTRLIPITELCSEFCCILDNFEEIIACEKDIDIDKDGFSEKWEAKMKD